MESIKLDNLTESDVMNVCQEFYSRQNECKNIGKIEIVSYDLRSIGETPTGYLSQQCKLTVQCRRNDDVEEALVFFIKSIPMTSAKHMEYIEDFGAFKKEISLYRTIIPDMQVLTAMTSWSPECYLTKKYNLMVMEDLTAQGYSLSKKCDLGLFDYNHMVVALQALAGLHGASIVHEKINGKSVLESYPNILAENAYPLEGDSIETRQVWIENSAQALCEILRQIPAYTQCQTQIVPKFKRFIGQIYEFVKTSKKYRNVFSHGDLWCNNVMFRYDAEQQDLSDSTPIAAKLLDYQLGRYAPPALDVLTIITITSNSDFRAKHLPALLDRYYNYLADELKAHNLNISNELPRSEFDESCNYYKLAGLIESCLFSHLTLLPKHLAGSIVSSSDNFNSFIRKSRAGMCLEAMEICKNYNHRMSDMISQIVDVYVLKNKVI